jgi:hypothetical protein
MRQFRRLHLRRRAQKVVPPDFKARIIAAHHAHPWTGYSDASIVHDRSCAIRRGKSCTCQPEIFIAMPDGSLIEIDAVGGCKLATRQ